MIRKTKICKTCGKDGFLWSRGNCKSCAAQNYTKSKQSSISPVSEKKKREQKVYSKLRKIYLQNNPFCEANLEYCTQISTQIHHKKGRIGSLYLDIRHWLAVCDSCHRYIELNPNMAKELGLSENRLTQTNEDDNN